MPKKWTRLDFIKVAAQAEIDPRTVASYLNGTAASRPAVIESIRRALKTFGIADPRAGETRGVL